MLFKLKDGPVWSSGITPGVAFKTAVKCGNLPYLGFIFLRMKNVVTCE